MSTYPTQPRAAFLQWCQAHAPIFSANATQIGLTTAQATAFASATTAVASGLLAQESAKQAYRVATQAIDEGLATLRGSAGDTVRLIRAFAEVQSKPSTIYNLAQIPPPAQPSPTPPPGSPTDFRIEARGHGRGDVPGDRDPLDFARRAGAVHGQLRRQPRRLGVHRGRGWGCAGDGCRW